MGDRRAEWIPESQTPAKKVKKEEEVEERAGIGEEEVKKEEEEEELKGRNSQT